MGENCRDLFSPDFPSLKKLDMNRCEFLETEDVNKVGLVSLEELNLAGSNWKNCEVLFSAEFPSLKKLDMSKCKRLYTEDVNKVGLVALEELKISKKSNLDPKYC